MPRLTPHAGRAFLAASALLAAVPAVRAADEDTLAVGRRFTLKSEVLGEERAGFVHLPRGYENGAQRYPVLYLTDADAQFAHTATTADFLARNGRIPPLIVVGIGNTDRTRDLTPTRASLPQPGGGRFDFPTSGGADRFLDFFEKELVPHVEQAWRTQPYRVFLGHSFGGLFALHAFTTRPALFDALVAVSPTFHWDDGLALRGARRLFDGRDELKKTLVVTLGSEGPELQAGYDAFEELLESVKARGFEWEMQQMRDEDHGSVVLRSHYLGLKRIFSGWRLPIDAATDQEVAEHYRRVSARFGFEVLPPEGVVNNLGYAALARKDVAGALALFEMNVRHYPGSANVHDSLGEGLEAAGRLDEARASYAKAVKRGQETNDANLAAYRNHLEALTAEQKPERGRTP